MLDCLFKQLYRDQHILLVGLHDAPIHEHLVQDVVGLWQHPSQHNEKYMFREHADVSIRGIRYGILAYHFQVEHQVQLTDVAEIPVQCLDQTVDEF